MSNMTTVQKWRRGISITVGIPLFICVGLLLFSELLSLFMFYVCFVNNNLSIATARFLAVLPYEFLHLLFWGVLVWLWALIDLEYSKKLFKGSTE